MVRQIHSLIDFNFLEDNQMDVWGTSDRQVFKCCTER